MSGSTTFHKAAPSTRAALCIFSPSRAAFWPLLLALLATLSVLAALDVAAECAWTANGPGLTFDENLNTASGVYVVESILDAGLAALDPRTLAEIFNSPNYYPDYPPLGRLPLGLSNALLGRWLGLGTHPFYLITYARVGSALAFGGLLLLISVFTARHAGAVAGIAAGVSLWLTPRVFGHAHLANVETSMNLAYAACVLGCAEWLGSRDSLRPRDGIVPGILLGFALLTKIQAIFLPPVLVIWMLWCWRLRGVVPLLVLALTSAAVFFAGWPWLWSDPFTRFFAYFGQTTDRAVLYCQYFGTRYADRAVPWHYPFVMFVVTTPIPWLLLGVWGMCSQEAGGREQEDGQRRQGEPNVGGNRRQKLLLLAAFWLPLIAFALPSVPVYDGERLFLIVWPLFSIWVGLGASRIVGSLRQRLPAWGIWSIAAILIAGPVAGMLSLQPCQLSFYSVSLGGLRGASALGMERTYWGDAVTADFLEQASQSLPLGAELAVAPVLHPLIPEFLQQDSWLRNRPDVRVVPYDDQRWETPYVLVIHRDADAWKSLSPPPAGTQVLAQLERQGVPLVELLKVPRPQSQ